MKINRMLLAAGGSALVLTLAGCWADDNNNDVVAVTPPSTAVPDSAGASAAAFVSYILTLGASDESSEPLTLTGTFAVPAEDSAEPTPLV